MNNNCLYLRKVSIDDAQLLFNWRNEKTTRENSFNVNEINFDEHMIWFKNILGKKDVFFYILMKEDIPVGQIRIAKRNDAWCISYSIGEQFRGCGYGNLILQLAECKLLENNERYVLFGEVKKENVASCKAFKNLGYMEECFNPYLVYKKSVGV